MKSDHICASLLCNSRVLFHKTGCIPKAPLFPFRGLLTFFFFNTRAASLAQPSWLPSNLSFHPEFHTSKTPCCSRSPRQHNSLQDGAGHEIPGEEFQSFTFVLSISKMSLALPLLLQPCCSSLHSSPLFSCQSPGSSFMAFPSTTELTQLDNVTTPPPSPTEEICGDTEAAKKGALNSQ